jgi:nucleotide-binding universal stress UspA family protein
MIRTVAVGIGGRGGWQALAWAIAEAERAGARLVIVHSCAPGSPLDRYPGDPTTAQVELADPALARAVSAIRTTLGGHRVDLKIRSTEPGLALVDASYRADLVVVGAGGRTTRRVVRNAHCPAIVVRPVTRGDAAPSAGHVVVGVDGSAAAHSALEFAFAYADECRLPLIAVHASEHGGGDCVHDEVTQSTYFTAEPAALELLGAETEPWALKYPGVRIRRAVLDDVVPDGLIRAGRDALLLVLGDKRRGVVTRMRTRDVPMTVAERAPCPVAVVPFERREGAPL